MLCAARNAAGNDKEDSVTNVRQAGAADHRVHCSSHRVIRTRQTSELITSCRMSDYIHRLHTAEIQFNSAKVSNITTRTTERVNRDVISHQDMISDGGMSSTECCVLSTNNPLEL